MKTITVEAIAKKETDKAIAVEVCYTKGAYENIVTKWFPKSQVVINQNTITIPTWILSNMFNEINIGTYATIGNTSICKLDII